MKILNLGLESINFQSGAFYKELIEIIEDARLKGYNKKNAEEVGQAIALCTSKHTNILTTVEFIQGFDNACIFPSAFTPESVLYNKDYGAMMKAYYDDVSAIGRGKKIEGWINPATAKVGGEFAKMPHKSYYDADFIFGRKRFSAAGAAAVVLHEVGHAFTFMQFVADTALLNLVLQQTYQELMGARDDTGFKIVIERARKKLQLEGPSAWSQEKGKDQNADTVIQVLASEAVMLRQNTDNKVIYTQDTAEEMAEIFCIRQGGSKGLIEVREYFAQAHDISKANFCILYGAMLAAAGALTLPVLGPVAFVIGLLGLNMFLGGNAAAATMPEFTKFSQTIGKVRNQMVEQLKQSKLPPETVKEILSTIEAAINSMKNTPDAKMPMAMVFWDFFRRGKRDTRAWREYTDQLEHMATNDLFVRAAAMSLKSSD